MISADNHGGWTNHLRRIKRWEERSLQAINDIPFVDFHEALDFSLAYFVWCHSLRDWLIKDGAIRENELDEALKTSPEWRICRDLANRSRHLVLTRNPTDNDWSVLREYDVFARQIEGRERHHLILFFGGEKYRLADLIVRTSRMWDDLLLAKGLAP